MAWPPPVLPINRTNADPQQDTHPNDHNALALGVNDITSHIMSYSDDHIGKLRLRQPFAAYVVGLGGTSGGAWQFIDYTFPAQLIDGLIHVSVFERIDFNGGSGYALKLYAAGVLVVQRQFTAAEMAPGSSVYVSMTTTVAIAVGATPQFILMGEGAANISVFGDGTVNRMDMIFIAPQY